MREPTQWRTKRPAWLIDLGVPSDFDERLNWLEDVYRNDIDDLCAVVAAQQEKRKREARKDGGEYRRARTRFVHEQARPAGSRAAIKDTRSSIEQLQN